MNSYTRKSMDGVRTRTQHRTSTPRSFPDAREENQQSNREQKPSVSQEKVYFEKKNKSHQEERFIKKTKPLEAKKNIFFTKKRIIFCVNLVIALAVVWWLGNRIEKTSITIEPHIEYHDVNLKTELHRNPKEHELGFDVIAITDEVSTSIPITGNEERKDYATGMVRISHLKEGGPVTLPPFARISNQEGKVFLFPDTPTIIPVQVDTKAGFTYVKVKALEPGPLYNVEPTAFKFLDLKEDRKLLVQSESSFTGGILGTQPQVSEEQKMLALQDLKIQLSKKLQKRIHLEKTDEFILVEGSENLQFQEPLVIEKDGSGILTLRGSVFALLVGDNLLSQYIIDEELDLPENQKFTIVNPETFSIKKDFFEGIFNYEKTTKLPVSISGRPLVESLINKEVLKEKVRGVERNALRSYITNNPEFDTAVIRIRPFWKKTATQQDERIHIFLKSN